ncbi:MAG: FG-GAP-like repeat-containing protein [Bacteroidota bacterium]
MKIRFIIYNAILITFLAFGQLAGQSAFISNIDKSTGSFNEIVTINGRGFSDDSSDLRVYFGAAEATIVSSSGNILEVRVPANATYDHINVINLSTGVRVASREKFLMSFGGSSFELGNIGSQNLNRTGLRGVFDLCPCDFNRDGNLDFVVTNNRQETGQVGRFSIFTNNSSIGNINFGLAQSEIDEVSFSDCGDLNGDGLQDLILAEGGTQGFRIYIFENTSAGSTINFTLATTLNLPRLADDNVRNIGRVNIHDLDNDGKPEIIATNNTDDFIDIFKNTSSSGNTSFDTDPLQFLIEGSSKTSAIDIQDLNNDGFDDVILIPLRVSDIFILPNTSDIGTIEFGNVIRLEQSGGLTSVKAADLNNDGFSDLVTIDGGVTGSNEASNDAHIFINNTGVNGGSITLQRNTTVQVNGNPESLDFGDLNGDGLVDIVTSSLKSDATAGLSVLINSTVGSTMTFNSFQLSTPSSSRNIRIADVDSDGRPDISFTHSVAGASFGDLSVFLNKNCVEPTISPEDRQVICSNNGLVLQATQTNGSTYRWELSINNGAFNTIQESDVSFVNTQDFLNPGESGNFRVTLSSEGGNCENTSNTVNIIVNSDVVNAPVPTSNGPVCPGDDLILTSNITGSTVFYEWTRPDGSTETLTDPVFTINDFQPSDAGRYELVIQSGSCRSAAGSVLVGSRNLPFTQISADGGNLLCVGDNKTLSVTSLDGFTYQWRLDGSDLPNETNTSINISNPGAYTVVITDDTGCSEEVTPLEIQSVIQPNNDINSERNICIGLPLDFQATATGQDGLNILHRWDFGDGNMGTGETTTHTYTEAGNYLVTLTSFYENLEACEGTAQFPVSVREVPDVSITTTDPNGLNKCPSDSIRLELPDNFRAYAWSTGSTESFAFGKTERGESSGSISVNWTDDAGCEGSSSEDYSNFPNSELVIESDFTITNDTIRLTEGVQSVSLSVSFGSDLFWEPEEVIENNTSNNVTVFPSNAFTNVMATGTTTNGCRETANVVIVNNFLVPRRTFSPNGDGLGFECWEILNASILDGCTVYIFDSKGTIIQELSTPFDANNCIWDGTTEGREAPEGVYYYALKCQDANFNRSGSILLAR